MENISIVIIAIQNPEGEWIGNVAVNTETFEIIDCLKNGYKLEEVKPPLV